MLEDLLNAEVYKADPRGIETARILAFGLLCKMFLQYLSKLIGLNDFVSLWLRILDFVYQYMRANDSANLVPSFSRSFVPFLRN